MSALLNPSEERTEGYISICDQPKDFTSSFAMLISLHIYFPLIPWICEEYLAVGALNKFWGKENRNKSKQWSNGSSWHVWVWAVPKVSVNVPEVDWNHVSLGGFTGCSICDVMRTRVNRLPTVTYRGAQCESAAKSFVETSRPPECCWAGWPHVWLLLDKSWIIELLIIFCLFVFLWNKQFVIFVE